MPDKWRNRIVEYRPDCPVGELMDNAKNWRIHPRAQEAGLAGVLGKIGKVDVLKAYISERYGGLTLFDGHLRKHIAPDETWPVVICDLTDEEADLVIATLDPLSAMAEADASQVEALLSGLSEQDATIKVLLDGLASKSGAEVSTDALLDDEPQIGRQDVPDALFPSDNDWGIPTLNADLQATTVDLPVSLWGAMSRTARMRGTWLFYCDDYRFEALWKDPSPIVNSQCANAVEPNFTIGPQTPKAVALWQIYRKRWLARWWQSYGVRVFVDMNVDTTTFGDIMLLGVPTGWSAYATHGYTDRQEFTLMEYELACQWAGKDDILFLLYGGGKECKALAQSRGWVWVSEHMDIKQGGVVKGG